MKANESLLSPSPKHTCLDDSFDIHVDQYDCLFVDFGFYAVSTVFQSFDGYSSQIHVSLTVINQYLTSPLS